MNFKKYHVSTNLFDKSSEPLHIGISNDNKIVVGTANWTAAVPCKPNTTYTVSKSRGLTFLIGYTTEAPDIGVDAYGVIGSLTDSFTNVLRITTGDNAAYLIIVYCNDNFINPPPQDVINSLNVNEGNEVLPYEAYYTPYWSDAPCYIHKTATDTITTLPADLYADGNNATVGLVGNMSQTGTPTPQNPIQPQECGERTGNLFDILTVNSPPFMLVNGTAQNAYGTLSDGVFTAKYGLYSQGIYLNYMLELSGGTYTISFDVKETIRNDMLLRVRDYDGETNILNETIYNIPSEYTNITRSFTITNTTKILIGIQPIGNAQQFTNLDLQFRNIMLNTGSQPLPYEPYGYKLDIKSANTTTPVYLGEVESTRRIKKVVLTGEETFNKNSGQIDNYLYYANRGSIIPSSISKPPVLCNELPVKDTPPQTEIGTNTNNSYSVIYFNFGADVMNAQPSRNTVDGLKEYLAARYAAGTPVTVWYVLSSATTGVVNEPLRKIGDYVDEVSGITIPTITGKDTFDVLTTLKPSEVSLSYTGWHDASVKEKSRNLFDISTAEDTEYYINNSGELVAGANGDRFIAQKVMVTPLTEYTFSWGDTIVGTADNSPYIRVSEYAGTEFLGRMAYKCIDYVNKTFTINVSQYTTVLDIRYDSSTSLRQQTITNIMLNEGSTALPYEPYWE